MNFYPEVVASGAAPTEAALYPTPGFQTFATMPESNFRGGWGINSATLQTMYVVFGGGFYEVSSAGVITLRGTLADDGGLVTIHYNGPTGGQLFITSGGNGYCYTIATTTLTQVLTNAATMGGMINSRFLAFDAFNAKVRMSALNDGTTWDPTLYFQRSQAPDPWKSMIVNPPEIWLLGETTGEVWYDSGAFPQPFAPIPGAFFPYGIAAPFSVGIAGGFITWAANTKDGVDRIVGAKGYTPQVISNSAVETAIGAIRRSASSGIQDCENVIYEEDGHVFGNFSFPSGLSTWTVDFSTGSVWHERGRWRAAQARYDVWGPRAHVYAYGRHFVGLRDSNVLMVMSNALSTEADGSAIRRLRIPAPLWASGRQRIQIDRFELFAEAGLGTIADASATGGTRGPLVALRTSDNTKTWSSERQASAGALGDYGKQIYWTRLGSAEKLFVPELVMTDAIPWRLSGADISGSGFAAGRAA